MARFDQVAENWANRTGKVTRAASAWHNPALGTLGHHGTAIAKLIETPKGKTVAFVATFGWNFGTNTSMLASLAKDEAKKAGLPVFLVAHLSADKHDENLADYESRVAEQKAKATTARTRGQDYIAMADLIRAEARRYRAAFGLSGKAVSS